jgi:glycosyltransferase involved in cell wall biosynthesis
MRILLITSGFIPTIFSENIVNGKLALAFLNEGWEVDIITKKYAGPAYSDTWQEPWSKLKTFTYEINYPIKSRFLNIIDFFICSIRMQYPLIGVRWALRAFLKAQELHKKKPYDFILSRSPNDFSHLVALNFSRKTKVKWIANWNDPADNIWPEPYTQKLNFFSSFILNNFVKTCIKRSYANSFPGNELLQHFRSFYNSQLHKNYVIPHISLIEELYPDLKSRKNTKLFTLCHSGNLSEERNPENLFKAIKKIKADYHLTNIKLDIMGTKNHYTHSLIQQYDLEDTVKFIGSLPYLESIIKLQEYHVLILQEAKLEEGIFSPSKLADYAQSTIPILALSPENGYVSRLFNEQGGGLAVNNKNVDTICETIYNIYKLWEAEKLTPEFNSELLKRHFSANNVVNIYKKIFVSD